MLEIPILNAKPRSWLGERVVVRMPAALSVGFMLFVFLPLMTYGLNLDVVDVSKRLLLSIGALFTAVSAAGLLALSFVPKLGGGVIVGCRVAATTLFILTVFPNTTGEATGFGGFLSGTSELGPALKLFGVLGTLCLWSWFRPDDVRDVSVVCFVTALLISGYFAAFETSAAELARGSEETGKSYFSELGAEDNAVVVVLDEFTGYRMHEVFEERPALAESFQGFTLYPRAIASARNTPAGLSALLSGDLELALEEGERGPARTRRMIERSVLAEAQKAGVDTAYLSFVLPGESTVPVFDEQQFFAAGELRLRDSASLYLSFWALSLSRVFPPTVFRAAESGVAAAIKRTAREQPTDWQVYLSRERPADRAVLASKMALAHLAESLRLGAEARRVLFFHSKLSHSPHRLTERGEFGPGDSHSTSRYVADAVASFLDRLRSLGSYDDALILVVSDHGGMEVKDATMGGLFEPGAELPLGFNPLVMVKPPRAGGPFAESAMTVWLGDVAATLRDFLGFAAPKAPMFESRSLLGEADSDRTIQIPIFYRSNQASHHGSLADWSRLPASGTFADYGPASVVRADTLLREPARVELSAGVDALTSALVKQGWWGGSGVQYEASIEIGGLAVSSRSDPGIAVLSNLSGEFELDVFTEFAEGVEFLRRAAADSTTFAVGLRVPRAQLDAPMFADGLSGIDAAFVSFVFARNGTNAPASFTAGENDAALAVDWRPGRGAAANRARSN